MYRVFFSSNCLCNSWTVGGFLPINLSEARKKYYENGGIKIFPINHGNNFRGKIVVNLQNGIFYENIKSAAESLNIKRTTLEYRLKKNIDQHFCYA